MQKESAVYSPVAELCFILSCMFVLFFSTVQTVFSIDLSLMGLSLLIVSAMLLVLLRRRVVSAWLGAVAALSDARYVTLQRLDEELEAERKASKVQQPNS